MPEMESLSILDMMGDYRMRGVYPFLQRDIGCWSLILGATIRVGLELEPGSDDLLDATKRASRVWEFRDEDAFSRDTASFSRLVLTKSEGEEASHPQT